MASSLIPWRLCSQSSLTTTSPGHASHDVWVVECAAARGTQLCRHVPASMPALPRRQWQRRAPRSHSMAHHHRPISPWTSSVACKPNGQRERTGNWIEAQMQYVAANVSCWSAKLVRNVFLMGACDLGRASGQLLALSSLYSPWHGWQLIDGHERREICYAGLTAAQTDTIDGCAASVGPCERQICCVGVCHAEVSTRNFLRMRWYRACKFSLSKHGVPLMQYLDVSHALVV